MADCSSKHEPHLANQVVIEPRIKRQAYSIVSKTRSDRMNMQEGPIAAYDDDDDDNNESRSVRKERVRADSAAYSICKSCHERFAHHKSSVFAALRPAKTSVQVADRQVSRMGNFTRIGLQYIDDKQCSARSTRFGVLDSSATVKKNIRMKERRSLDERQLLYGHKSSSSDRRYIDSD